LGVMSATGSHPDGVVAFYPFGLLHKFGFGDGDMMYDVVEELGLGVYHRDLLVAVVEGLLVSLIEQEVETYTLVSLHNPIRAATIDGEKASPTSTLTPEIIEISVTEIIRVAQTLPPEEEEDL
jgi:hypothetical protein